MFTQHIWFSAKLWFRKLCSAHKLQWILPGWEIEIWFHYNPQNKWITNGTGPWLSIQHKVLILTLRGVFLISKILQEFLHTWVQLPELIPFSFLPGCGTDWMRRSSWTGFVHRRRHHHRWASTIILPRLSFGLPLQCIRFLRTRSIFLQITRINTAQNYTQMHTKQQKHTQFSPLHLLFTDWSLSRNYEVRTSPPEFLHRGKNYLIILKCTRGTY